VANAGSDATVAVDEPGPGRDSNPWQPRARSPRPVDPEIWDIRVQCPSGHAEIHRVSSDRREPGEVSGATTGLVVRYVHQTLGDPAVEQLLRLAGATRTAEELLDTTTWSSLEQWLRLLDAAVELTGDEDVGIRVGEQLLAQHAGTEVAALLRSLGSPGEVLRNVAITATKYTTISMMEAEEVGDAHAIISARSTNDQQRTRQSCNVTIGVLSQAPPLFGMAPACVEQLECEADGDGRCLYRVTWDPTSAQADPRLRIEQLERELAAMTTRFETLQATAAELVSAEDIETVLAGITRRAGLAVRAPRYALAVRVTATAPLRVHHSGFTAKEVEPIVAGLLDDTLEGDNTRLVVDVASHRQHYGRLAAFYPTGMQFFTQERKLLAAYARHAAAALDTAAALDEARRRDRSARALLELAKSLAEVATPDEVARRLVDAVPSIVDCSGSTVFLWDPHREELRAVATASNEPARGEPLDELVVSAHELRAVQRLVDDPAPVFVDDTAGDQALRKLLTLVGVKAMAAVPIVARGEFLGLVTAGAQHDGDQLRSDDDVLERLTGLADQAAVALQNAHLLERIQHEALHDALTGLANQRLLEGRVDMALASTRRTGTGLALVFLDLDRFKQVNDEFGHDVGDVVLRALGDALRSAVRLEDTVARFGGDEFVVVLTNVHNPDDVSRSIERIVEAVREPVIIGEHVFTIDASVGVASFPHDGDDYRSLLKRADADMYRTKTQRRATMLAR
jgi:diguanylate cyclase (GGDEF)-like protein